MKSKLASKHRWEKCPLLTQNWRDFQKQEAGCAGLGNARASTPEAPHRGGQDTRGEAGKIPMSPEGQAELVRATGHCRPLPHLSKDRKHRLHLRPRGKWPKVPWGIPRAHATLTGAASSEECLRTKITLGVRGVCRNQKQWASWNQAES